MQSVRFQLIGIETVVSEDENGLKKHFHSNALYRKYHLPPVFLFAVAVVVVSIGHKGVVT
jgi:hypothetical protein